MKKQNFLQKTSFWYFVSGFALGMMVLMVVSASNSSLLDVQTKVIDGGSRNSQEQIQFMNNPSGDYYIAPQRNGSFRVFHQSGEYDVVSSPRGTHSVKKSANGSHVVYPVPQGGYVLYPTPQGG
ncbi:hypothetical protein JKY72_00040 [Candidatus Gracilibacteria bacterium]|nr:hypothetical protein [Candidatus Gracilibacteria bacterium]